VKVAYVSLCGFRGYRKPIRIEFADSFTILDGRNGVGKSTIFDAVEFALTGTLSKYGDIRADGETVADYIWWTGAGPAPHDRFVEVGFFDGKEALSIRRTQVESPSSESVQHVTSALCDQSLAPVDPLQQLVSTAIIRDEHISSLSLDLKETDRYELLRSGLGSNDAERWITRASEVLQTVKKRSTSVQQELALASAELTSASRRIDEVRANLTVDTEISEAVRRLRVFAKSEVEPDRLTGPVRLRLAAIGADIEALTGLAARWSNLDAQRQRLDELVGSRSAAAAERDAASADVAALQPSTQDAPASHLAQKARDLIALAEMGRNIGLLDGHCPLCSNVQTDEQFQRGVSVAESFARELDEMAAARAAEEAAHAAARRRLQDAQRNLDATEETLRTAQATVDAFDQELSRRGLTAAHGYAEVTSQIAALKTESDGALRDLRLVETLRFSAELERAQRAQTTANDKLARLQERAGRTRKAEADARAIHDAARRAASETLDRQLDRVLPLLSELYQRLRPHPIWRDIEYSIRGDVKRFLRLKVGDELNPQFLFSSGQRRSTGLAFLLSVNLALAWNRWRTVMLDDPVQHVDDFRTLHLAELLAVLTSDGRRQVICAVEDAALADLLCRRLPIHALGAGKRITLGPDRDGDLAVENDQNLTPHVRRALLPEVAAAIGG
jgi:DNA repair exonuclease SbcCD ATPase subunit